MSYNLELFDVPKFDYTKHVQFYDFVNNTVKYYDFSSNLVAWKYFSCDYIHYCYKYPYPFKLEEK